MHGIDSSFLLGEILDHDFFGVVVTGKDLETIVLFSQGAENIFGYPSSEMVGKNVKSLYKNPEEREAVMGRLYTEGRIVYETQFKKKQDGNEEIIDLIFSLKLMKDAEGNPIGTLGMVRDTTGRRKLERVKEHLEKEKDDILKNMINLFYYMLFDYDTELANHTQRVSVFSEKILREMGASDDEINKVYVAFMLHDIGKINIKKRILLNGKRYLTDDQEMKDIREHTTHGEQILTPTGLPNEIILVAKHHHERYDGKGYPGGLKGEDIPKLARVLSIADSYDSMTQKRPYKLKMDKLTAIEELKRCSGMDFEGKRLFSYNRKALKRIVLNNAKGFAGIDRKTDKNMLRIMEEYNNLFRYARKDELYDRMISISMSYRKKLKRHSRPEIMRFLNNIDRNAKTYLIDRMMGEIQFDPKIVPFVMNYLQREEENSIAHKMQE